MSDKSTLIKETKEYLEDAQKEVLKTLNSETSFLSRLFSNSAKNNLKLAQSSISKAMNKIKNMSDDQSGIVGKLQKHISERDEKIKNLENETSQKDKEAGLLKDQLRQIEGQLSSYKNQPEQKQETIKPPLADNSKLEEGLREAIAKLEEKNKFLSEKLNQNQDELRDSNDLVLEFATRIKRLKSEVTTK